MAGPDLSTKRLAISKAQAQMVGVVAAAAFVTVFCLIASKSVFGTNQYQGRVTKQKEIAHKQLQQNLSAFDSLVASYKKFDSKSKNVIDGSKTGSGDNDGNNSKIILDALPSTYDFPALTSSVEKILTDRHFKVSGITGVDDQLAQQGNISSASPVPTPMPFSFNVDNAGYGSVQDLVKALQASIRPIQIDTLDLEGGTSDMQLTIAAHTYYQPAKSVNISTKVVK
jgi:hypothetical protein